jgi:hypothetical protein
MAQITLSDDQVHIELTTWEKISGLMGDRTIPRASITEVALETDSIRAARGLRAPGLGIPGRVKIGTWRGKGRKSYVCARRSTPAVRIETTGLDRDSFLVSVPDARQIVDELTG